MATLTWAAVGQGQAVGEQVLAPKGTSLGCEQSRLEGSSQACPPTCNLVSWGKEGSTEILHFISSQRATQGSAWQQTTQQATSEGLVLVSRCFRRLQICVIFFLNRLCFSAFSRLCFFREPSSPRDPMVAHSSKSPGVKILTALRNGCLLPSVELLRGALDDLELELATIDLTLYLRALSPLLCNRSERCRASPAPTKAWWHLHRVRFIEGLVVFCLFVFERGMVFLL